MLVEGCANAKTLCPMTCIHTQRETTQRETLHAKTTQPMVAVITATSITQVACHTCIEWTTRILQIEEFVAAGKTEYTLGFLLKATGVCKPSIWPLALTFPDPDTSAGARATQVPRNLELVGHSRLILRQGVVRRALNTYIRKQTYNTPQPTST